MTARLMRSLPVTLCMAGWQAGWNGLECADNAAACGVAARAGCEQGHAWASMGHFASLLFIYTQ
jgi:hypothetical protein